MTTTSDARGSRSLSLEDRYEVENGEIYLTAVQAIVRVLLDRRRADLRAGLNTGGFVSGYPGSPVGGIDVELNRRQQLLDAHRVVHVPGLNEDLAATAVFGSQTVNLLPGATVDGVFAMWFGKAPGVDRSADAFRHANIRGVARHGGIIAIAGDDPAARSSMMPTDSNQALHDWKMPILFPGTVQEILDLGQHGYALSRSSGLIVGMKMVTNVADSAGMAQVSPDRVQPIIPTVELDGKPFEPIVRLNVAGQPMREAERDLFHARLELARRYILANELNPIVVDAPGARIGIVAPGTAYFDLRTALSNLGLDGEALGRAGVRIKKVNALFPVAAEEWRQFADGLEEIIVVEEKRPFLEQFLRDALYDVENRPRVIGKSDEHGAEFLPQFGEFSPDIIGRAVGTRLRERFGVDMSSEALATFSKPLRKPIPLTVNRTAYFCSGCPHNRSLITPEGSLVGAGIGCHVMAIVVPREEYGEMAGYTQMGGEGAQWIGIAPFTSVSHIFQNLGDGTFHHSGSLAIRFAVASGANITYKLLYNSAVGMTGGQDVQGAMSVPEITRALAAEGVARSIVTTDDPKKYKGASLADGVQVWHRDRLLEAQEVLAATPGTTVLIHDQQCAAEKRRLRKRNKMPEPTRRVIIDDRVCEGCGDCGAKSQCLSVQPVETTFGRKTQIHQSSCNLDFSCLLGDCPSFITVDIKDARPIENRAPALPDLPAPAPARVSEPAFTIHMAGIGGTGVVTVSQILATAATIDGHDVRDLDLTGASQKAGPVVSQLQIMPTARHVRDEVAPTISVGNADLLLAFDMLTAVDPGNLAKGSPDRTVAMVSSSRVPTGAMSLDPSLPFPDEGAIRREIEAVVRPEGARFVDTASLALDLFGNHMMANMILVGAAVQAGYIPLTIGAIEQAIRLNGAAVEDNIAAFQWGRVAVAAPAQLPLRVTNNEASDAARATATSLTAGMDLDAALRDVVEIRLADLVDYQNVRYAERFLKLVAKTRTREREVEPASTALTDAVARGFHKVMAYKDEYEVARLLTRSASRDAIEREFGKGAKATWNLHPPALRSMGLDRKLRLGGWFRPALSALAVAKPLRGRRLDPFGRAQVRRVERALVDYYESQIDAVLDRLDVHSLGRAVELADAVDVVRGYEDIKLDNIRRYLPLVQDLSTLLGISVSRPRALNELTSN